MKITVTTPTAAYPIHCEKDFTGLGQALAQAGLAGRPACVVADATVAGLYLRPLLAQLGPVAPGPVPALEFPPGEASKTLGTVQTFYEFFAAHRLHRNTLVVALGGGVTGDAVGFAAATYLRGLPYVQVPTTLLAQVDSSVGGKTGVDFAGQKNSVGAFYHPALVYMSLDTLKTLPAPQFASGMAEAVKHGLIRDPAYFRFIQANREALRGQDPALLAKVVLGSCEIKAAVVAQDERETTGLREILNFGHTVGHAVESLSGFALPHGHCVALGMAAALGLSPEAGVDVEEVCGLLAYFGLPTRLQGPDFDGETVYQQMQLDKKNKDGTLRMVLLRKLGAAYLRPGVDKAALLNALTKIGVNGA